MEIKHISMTRKHYQTVDERQIRMVVLHATAGRAPGDFHWLRQGGDERRPISVHYYIDKKGTITQFVDDKHIAWHAGVSSWVVDGERINGCNAISVGIELENLNNGRDPYPQAQYDAAVWLTKRLVSEYAIPRNQLVRHLDIAPRRKTDPAGFPWERFTADVYAAATRPDDPPPADTIDAEHLRRVLVEFAYRVAGGAAPEGWLLGVAAADQRLGMPVAAITGHQVHTRYGSHRASSRAESQNDQDRAVTIAHHPPFVVEAYAGDLLYIDFERLDDGIAALEHIQRLSATPDGVLRDGLLEMLFRTADPVNGFRPDWAFHQYYLQHMDELGVPISPNYRLSATTSDGQQYACQHFAFDTLCSPVGQWRTIIRLSDLEEQVQSSANGDAAAAYELNATSARELREMLLDALYQRRARQMFDPEALFCQLARELGAPLGPAETANIGDQRIVMMSFARDVAYCRAPAGWQTGQPLQAPNRIERLSELLADVGAQPLLLGGDQPSIAASADGTGSPDASRHPSSDSVVLIGAPAMVPALCDLSAHTEIDALALDLDAERIVLQPVGGSLSALSANNANHSTPAWHYYVDLAGGIFQLLPETAPVTLAQEIGASQSANIPHGSLLIAVEEGVDRQNIEQVQTLAWLLKMLAQRWRISSGRIFLAQPAFISQEVIQR